MKVRIDIEYTYQLSDIKELVLKEHSAKHKAPDGYHWEAKGEKYDLNIIVEAVLNEDETKTKNEGE